MKPAHKQMALKGALFMILAANVSWHTSKSFNSADMASELGTSRASVPARTTGDSSNIPVIKIQPPPQAVTGARPDPAIGATVVPTVESTASKTFCAVSVDVHYYQRTDNGTTWVYADVTRKDARSSFLTVRLKGNYTDVMNDSDRRAKLANFVRDNSIDKLKAEGESCDGGDRTAPPSVVDRQPTAPSDDRDSDDDSRAKKIARGVKNCTLDSDGHPLRDWIDKDREFHSDRFDCNLARLDDMSLDAGNEETDIPDVDISTGRTARRPRSRDRDRDRDRNGGMAQVTSIVASLENSIRFLLKSDDLRDQGEDRLEDLITSLDSLRSTTMNSSVSNQLDRMIKNLKTTYPLGEKVDKTADAYASRMNTISSQITDLQTQMAGANGYQQMALRNQVSMLQMQQSNLQSSLAQNQDFLRLRAYQQAGILSQNEYSDFASDYLNLLGGSNALAMSPTDLSSGRSSILDRASGFQTGYPTNFNWQAAGVQNPTTIMNTQGVPQSNLPMTLPTNVPITSSSPIMMQNGYIQNGYQYNPTVMSTPMRL